jgi:pyruvate kinase
MSKTKIVCTIGPASDSEEMLEKLILEGMNVARLNFSHGSHDQHGTVIRRIRRVSQRLGRHIAILQDLCGPKIRVGRIPGPGITLVPGRTIRITGEEVEGTVDRISVSYTSLPEEVSAGDRILLADGFMELVVLGKDATEITCEVISGGMLTSHKGINLPSGTVKAASLTDKDRKDLLFGLENDVDFVALSFVRSSADIVEVKDIIDSVGKSTPVIAKIEKHEAIDNLTDIVRVADGIMVARGDLGVEVPLENVPWIQKEIVKRSNALCKPVIIATQMLRSMVDSPRPTRAEATDVANAVLDGADALMLSEETAMGQYPVAAVAYMKRIASGAEKGFPHKKYLRMVPRKDLSAAVAHASCVLASHQDAAAIVATTKSGFTAKQTSRFRPAPALIALSPDPAVLRNLALYWGCIPDLENGEDRLMEDRLARVAEQLLENGLGRKGDTVVITAGVPAGVSGTTNMMQVKTL